MEKIALLKIAKNIVNNLTSTGFFINPLKKAANTDLDLFLIYLKNIAEQSYDPKTEQSTINLLGDDLVKISKILYPQEEIFQPINLNESKRELKTISNKFNVSLNKLESQLEMGKKFELEHTNDIKIAEKIALDHLKEIPDYYTRLKKMENKAKKELK